MKTAIDFLKDIKDLKNLAKHIYPAMLTTVLGALVMSAFWTIGGLLGESIEEKNIPEWTFLIAFNLAQLTSTVQLANFPISQQATD